MEKQTFGDRVRYFRKKAGLSQADLAKRMGVNHSAVAYLELRDNRPKYKTVEKLAAALSITPAELYPDIQEPEWNFGRRVRAFRIAQNLSQWDLARKMETGQSRIHAIETGRHTPTIKTVMTVAKALGMTIDELVNGDMAGYKPYQDDLNAPSTCDYCGYVGYAHFGHCPQCNAKIGE